MLLSCNEIQVHCEKALFSIKRNYGNQAQIANSILIGQKLGLPVINIFNKNLKTLKNKDINPDISIKKNHIIIDIKGTSPVLHLYILLEMVVDIIQKDTKNSYAYIEFKNSNHQYLAIGMLFEFFKKQKSLNISFSWQDKKEELYCDFNKDRQYPNIYKKQINDNLSNKSLITFKKNTIIHDFKKIKYTEEELKNNYDTSIAKGVSVNEKDFQDLKVYADLILVKESLESLKNAGE